MLPIKIGVQEGVRGMANKKTKTELRSLRTQQILSVAIGLIVILSMILSLVAK
jgi:hypothetical protein